MTIRKAKEKDIPRLLDLLSQVLEIHAQIRPDIFVSERLNTIKPNFKNY